MVRLLNHITAGTVATTTTMTTITVTTTFLFLAVYLAIFSIFLRIINHAFSIEAIASGAKMKNH
jgi:hypothetical protein